MSIDNTELTTKTYKPCMKCGHLTDVKILDSYVSKPTITDQQIEAAARKICDVWSLSWETYQFKATKAAKAALTAALGVE